MADTKISALTAATLPLAPGDEFALIQSTTSKMATMAQVADAVKAQGYDMSTISLATEDFLLHYQHMKISGTNRLSLAGTSEAYISDFGNNSVIYAGVPKGGSFTVLDNFVYDLIKRLTLQNQDRATLKGSADMILSGDFETRQRIVLAG